MHHCVGSADAGTDDDEAISECEDAYEETYSSDSDSEDEDLPSSANTVPSQTPSTAPQDKVALLHCFNFLLHSILIMCDHTTVG